MLRSNLHNSQSKILFQLTGSIACFKACQAISDLMKRGYEVQVVASPSALQFVGAATLEGLTGKPVLSDLYERGHAMDHIHLAREYDVLVLCPATANTINRLAAGLADDLIGALYLAAEKNKPYLIFPAMNVQMLHHPATQHSLETLKSRGAQVLDTGAGALACGESGEGRLLEPAHIVATIERSLRSQAPPKHSKNRVLITYGGTAEPVDDVRVITNRSTGATGAAIADHFSRAGWQTTVLAAKGAVMPMIPPECLDSFVTTQDLKTALLNHLKTQSFDAVIHMAAVSDYSVKKQEGKIPSTAESLTLTLQKNPKLIDEIRSWSKNSSIQLVAFKLTSGLDEKAAQKKVAELFEHSHADVVVHNDLTNLDNRTVFVRGGHGAARHVHSTLDLSQGLLELCSKEIPL